MARTNLLDTVITNFLELPANGRVYRVPPYQRDFSWEEEESDDLWNDLLKLRTSGRECDPETDPSTIEHILPANLTAPWTAMFPEHLWQARAYRLGNLTLLQVSLNRLVANAEYSHKVQAYPESGYVLTRNVAEMAPERWTPELLDARQRRLAVRARHLWRADFA